MVFDFKKEYKELYAPKAGPGIVTVPPARYIAVDGQGDPNLPGGEYKQVVGVLYAVAYALKMSYRGGREIPGFFEYVVPPLEGFWWQNDKEGVGFGDKSAYHWTSVLRLPYFVRPEDFQWALDAAGKKKKLDCSKARLLTVDEGLCVQMLHTGPYDSEPETIAVMDAYIAGQGYENDMGGERRHHEIYLSDPARTPPEKWRTVIRHPIKRTTPTP